MRQKRDRTALSRDQVTSRQRTIPRKGTIVQATPHLSTLKAFRASTLTAYSLAVERTIASSLPPPLRTVPTLALRAKRLMPRGSTMT